MRCMTPVDRSEINEGLERLKADGWTEIVQIALHSWIFSNYLTLGFDITGIFEKVNGIQLLLVK